MAPAVADTQYQQTLDYLYTRLPMFSRIGAAALKPDLSNTLALCKTLDHPEKKFRSIHIAGTNGKGSTSHMLAAILQDAGYKTGLYTSPHLVDFRERIRINGAMVSEEFVCRFVERIKPLVDDIEPSFFEITVAMAFQAFAEEGVDVAVIETGLGGRLDSTNVITPELSIITNISLDHTDLLGRTIAEIAKEKAGIVKPGIPLVIGASDDESDPVFSKAALYQGSRIYEANAAWSLAGIAPARSGGQHFKAVKPATGEMLDIVTDLGGKYQHENLATVLTAVDVLAAQGWALSTTGAAHSLTNVKGTTGLRGRWDVLQEAPLIIADVAHNPAGLQAVMQEWNGITAKTKHIIVGFVQDKDVRTALACFPKDAVYHFCAANIPRALPAIELANIASDEGLKGESHSSVQDAVSNVRLLLQPQDALLITGSFFVVGEALASF